MAADPSQTVFDWKMIVSPPKDYDRWQALVQAFVAHSVERYGADVVNTWHFEVWNEPECCGGKFWKGSLENYFTLYGKAAAGVRAVLPNGRVGGPVSSQPVELTENSRAASSSRHIKAQRTARLLHLPHLIFIDGAVGGYSKASSCSTAPGTPRCHRRTDSAQLGFGLLGGEWSLPGAARNRSGRRVRGQSIRTRAALRQEGKRFPLAYAWWTLSDVFDEGYEDPGDYAAEQKPFIGHGLLSRENIKKPAYNAYTFLAKMGDEQWRHGRRRGQRRRHGARLQGRRPAGHPLQRPDPGGWLRDDKYYSLAEAKSFGVTVSG